MTTEERIAYFRGCKHMYEGFLIRLESEAIAATACIEAAAFLHELGQWVESPTDQPPPHPRVRRVHK